MAKKKKYRVSSKPRVAAMNEYIYSDIKKDLAKEFKVNRPYKPKKIKKAQAMKGVTIRQGKPTKYGPKPDVKINTQYTARVSRGGKPMPNIIPKGIDPQKVTKEIKRSGYGVGEPMNTEGIGKKKFGIGREVKVKGKTRIMTGDKIGYQIANTKMDSQITPPKQGKMGGMYDYRKGQEASKKYPKGRTKDFPVYRGNQQPYKYGTSSPIKVNKKAISGTAKKAVLARGAKIAVKGASRLIPGVGTAMLVKDVYDITKWASKQPKVKKANKIYGTQANKIYKYNK